MFAFLADQQIQRQGVVGRYAPSPTGPQHMGNLRTALLAWLHVRIQGGVFIVRMEDLDTPRVRAGSAARILDDLNWLGLDVDEGPDVKGAPGANGSCVQSERQTLYEAALSELARGERIYACYCSRKDIREAASAPHGPEGVIYPGTCASIQRCEKPKNTDPDIVLPGTDRKAAWRLRVDDTVVAWTDLVRGRQEQALGTESGDFVVRRADGIFAYQLAVAVDDALMGITDVVRGDDLLASTPRQIYVMRQLGLIVPRYWHVPVLCDETGERLSKRTGSESLAPQRENGVRPEKIIGELAAGIGLVEAGVMISARELAESLDLQTFINALCSNDQVKMQL